jgi:toluene monooxygenase electron transfer component
VLKQTFNHTETHWITVAGSPVRLPVEANDTILCALLRSGVGVPYECSAGGCGSCKFTLVDGEVSQDIDEPGGLRPSDLRKNKRLACISKPASDCFIELKLDDAYIPAVRPCRQTAHYVDLVKLTHDLWEFRFKTAEPARFLPGQYARVHLSGVAGPRNYSMSNTANNEGIWSFFIKRVPGGHATTVLFSENLHDAKIEIDAPYSIAHLDTESSRPIVCIVGGSGLAPAVSVIRGAAEHFGSAANATLYYGARTPDNVISANLFDGIPGFNPSRQYIPVVSDAKPGDGWSGPTGFMHEYLAEALGDTCAENDYYIAGPPPMVEAVRRHLVLNCGVSIGQLHYDRFF